MKLIASRKFLTLCSWLTCFVLLQFTSTAQSVIIVVIDGPRYSEMFGAGSTHVPNMQSLAAEGALFSNFRNDSLTLTNPGHAAILTGTWQPLANDGSQRPTFPTLFENFRKQKNSLLSENFVVSGKSKLNILTHSTHSDYGSDYSASFVLAANDHAVYDSLISIMQTAHPRLILANFPSVDVAGHSGSYEAYLAAIHAVDSLIYELWQTIQSLPFYRDSTTLFITADHGRHDDANGGFQHHGDGCDGCVHIFLLALGRGVPSGEIRTNAASQIDLAPTVAGLLGFSAPLANGINLFPITTTSITNGLRIPVSFVVNQNYPNPFNPSTNIVYGLPELASTRLEVFNILGQLLFSQDHANQAPGYYDIVWNGSTDNGNSVSTGVYIYRLTATSPQKGLKFVQTKRMVLLK